MKTPDSICKFNQHGFCKFQSYCRKMHVSEHCMETKCENENCLKRHPKNCKFYDAYNRCKFGEYCAFAHKENPLVKEMKTLKISHAILSEDLNEKANEVMDLKDKVEALETIVMELVNRVENIVTPTQKGTNKRRRLKQTLTPSPNKKNEDIDDKDIEDPTEEVHDKEGTTQTGQDSDEGESEITVEEIMKMYESG